jgi:hypothetical protein
LGFNKSVVDPNLYYYIVGDKSLILMTYSRSHVVGYKQASTSDFKMKDLGMMHYFLGKEVCQRTNETFTKSRKIYNGDIKEVQYDRMQIHLYTDGD